ncbi:Chorismate mutase [Frankia sp. AiPs1]
MRPVPMPTYRGHPHVADVDLLARIQLLVEQMDYALAEIALRRAAYWRVCEEEADWQWAPGGVEGLRRPPVAEALALLLAALGRLRLWAQELHWLQEQARLRGLLAAG